MNIVKLVHEIRHLAL